MFSNLFNTYRANHVGVFLASCFIVLACLSNNASAQEADAETAGQLLFTHGTVEITRNEETTSASRGEDLFNQDLLTTGTASSAQIRFTDNSLIAVRPETEFLIEDYSYDETNPENGRQSTQLIRGSLRAMTGAIGQARPENVEFKTPVATMGIRGTVLSIVHIPEGSGNSELAAGTYLQVESGSVELMNNSGAQTVTVNEDEPPITVYVSNEDEEPETVSNDIVDNYIASQQTQQDDENDEENNDTSNNNDGNNNNNSGSGTSNSSSSSSNNNPNNQNSGTTTPPDDANTNQGEDDIEETTPDPEPLPEFGLDFSPYGIFGILAGGDITPTGEFTIGDYSTPALRFDGGETFESGYFNTSKYYPGSNSDINWARWAYGDYELVNSILDDVDTGFDFMYLLTSNPITDSQSFLQAMNRSGVSTGSLFSRDSLRFNLASGPGISLDNGEAFSIGQNSFVSVSENGQIYIEIDFGYGTTEADRTMFAEASFMDLFNGFIALSESGTDSIILDGTRLIGVASGTEEWGLDAFLAALEIFLRDPASQEQVNGYGMLAFINDCVVNFPCPYLNEVSELTSFAANSEALGSNGQVTLHTNAANSYTSFEGWNLSAIYYRLVAQQASDASTGVVLTDITELELGPNLNVAGVSISWGYWSAGTYQTYTTDTESGETTWFEPDTNYHYIWVSEGINTSPTTSGEMHFRVVGGSGLVSESDGRVLEFLEGDINVNFDEQSMGVVFVFDNNGNQAVLSGSNLDLLAFLNNEEGVTLASEEFDSGSMFGGFAGEGLDALIAMLEATLGDETFRGTGVFESYEIAEELPSWGENFSPYGIFAELAEGTPFPTQDNFLDSYSISSLAFQGLDESNAELFSYGGFNTSEFYYNSDSNIEWARWANGNYTLQDSLGDELTTPYDFMYLLSDQFISPVALQEIVGSAHSGQELKFTLFDSPGVTLNNGNMFSIGYSSHISLDANAEEITIVIDFGYNTDEMNRQMLGSASFADVFDGFIALSESGEEQIILDGTRIYTTLSGSINWGLDSILASLFILLEDPQTQEQVEGYGMLAFVNDCIVNFPCPVFGVAQPLSSIEAPLGGALGMNGTQLLRSDASNTFLTEGFVAQRDPEQNINFLLRSLDTANQPSTGGTTLEVNGEEIFFLWGHWGAGGYDLYGNADATREEITPLDTTSNYHYILATEIYSGDLPVSGVFNFDYLDGSGLVSETDGRVIDMSEGIISVNFDSETLGLLFIFDDDGNELVLSGTNLDLWNFLNGSGTVTLEGQGFDSGSIAGSFAGENMDAIMALIRATLGEEEFAGSGVFAYTPPLEVTDVGNGLTLAGYLQRGLDSSIQTAALNDVSYLTEVESEEMIFNAGDGEPGYFETYSVNDWNPDSSNVISWGVWDAQTYSLFDSNGYELSNNHAFPYMLSEESIDTITDVRNIMSAVHINNDPMTFKLGGGTGVNLSNGEVIALDESSRVYIDVVNESVRFELDFTYTGEQPETSDQLALIRNLTGSGSVEEFYNNYIELEETAPEEASKIVELARMYGALTGNEETGIDALLTGLFLAIKDASGNEANGFGLHYFLYCWMSNTCEEEVVELAYGGLMDYGYFPSATIGSQFYSAEDALGSSVWHPGQLADENRVFRLEDAPTNTNMFLGSAYHANSGPGQASYWGFYDTGTWNFYDLGDSDYLEPLDGSGNRPFHYAFTFDQYNLNTFADADVVLDGYTGPMSFRLLGATPVHFASGEHLALQSSSSVTVDPVTNNIAFQIDFRYSGEGFDFLHELTGNGDIETFYNSFIELTDDSSDNIVDTAAIFGQLTGTNIGAGTIGNMNNYQNVDGLLAALLVSLIGEETDFGMGTIAFAHCYLNNDCSFTNLPTIPGMNLTNAGILDRSLAQMASDGTTVVEEISAGFSAPTHLETQAYTFTVDEFAFPLYYDTYDLSFMDPNVQNRIHLGIWEGGSYTLLNQWGDVMDNSADMPYLFSDYTLGSSYLVETIAGANHTGMLQFDLFQGTGMQLSNNATFALLAGSHLQLDLDAESISEQISVSLEYFYDTAMTPSYLTGSGSVAQLYEGFIALSDLGSDIDYNDARFYGSFAGDMSWGLDSFLAGLYVDFWDGSEHVTGYGQFAFLSCLLSMPGYTETNIASGCGGGGFDPMFTLVSDYYVGKSPAVFAVNNSMGYRALDTGENSAFFDIFQNGNPVLVSSGEAFYGGTGYLFNIISENPTDDWTGGTEYVDTLGGVEQEEVQWGYWAPNSYELEESYDEYTQYPLDTNDRFFYMVVSDTTDVTMLPILQSEIGSATFAVSGGSGGLINTQNGNFSTLTGGSLYVDFTGETFDVDLQFGAGNSLSALEADIFALFNYTPITLDGTGVFGGGSLQGTFVGPEAEGVAAMISAWLTANEETLRGITVFERIP